MRRGGRDSWGHRGGEPYRGRERDSIDDCLELVNPDTYNYHDGMDNPQDPWDPDIEQFDGDASHDEDDELA